MAFNYNYTTLLIYILINIVAIQTWKVTDSAETCGKVYGRDYRKPIASLRKANGALKAIPGDFPFIVSIQDKEGKHFCAGTVIDIEWVLTAANCFAERFVGDFRNLKIRAGLLHNDHGVEHLVKTLENHDLFSTEYYQNNLALVKVSPQFNFTEGKKLNGRGSIAAVCLPENNTEHDGTGTVVGWGFTVAKSLTLLHAADVTLFNCENDCYCKNEYPNFNQKIMICAGNDKRNKTNQCQGDAGGPLVGFVDNKVTVLGVVSNGEGCGETYKHGVYTKVSKFLKWIEKIINSNSN